MSFKEGDIVKSIGNKCIDGRIPIGILGKVLFVYMSKWIEVEWSIYVDGHSCNGRGKEGYCWSVDYRNIKLIGKSNEN
jgi:hypothetical protein